MPENGIPTAALPPEPAPFVTVWVESLSRLLETISRTPSPCTALSQPPPELPAPAEEDLWLICACSGGLRGEMSLRIPGAPALRLAEILSGEMSGTAGMNAEKREAAVELIRQAGGLAASSLKSCWGEIQLGIEPIAKAPSWPASATFWICVSRESASETLVEMHLSAALVAALRAEKGETCSPITPPAIPDPAASESPDPKVNLRLLMNVGLAVTLRFGSRRLLLREVLDLSPGSVVELDRLLQDPADLLLDGRLVARGEVVIVDGNYALRISEVGPPVAEIAGAV
jgi:flagellar motor switch protein FliN